MILRRLQRPAWTRTFIEEPEEEKHAGPPPKQSLPFRAFAIGLLAFCGLIQQVALLETDVGRVWIIPATVGWALLVIIAFTLRPRRFSLTILVALTLLFAANSVLIIRVWHYPFTLRLRLAVGTFLVAFGGIVVTINLPMRDPSWSTFGISKPYNIPTNTLRSPEDNVTFWQWMSVSWVSPLLKVAKGRQLNEEDVWLLPYEYQHTYLHNAFRKIKGSVLRRLLVANWVDLAILALLEFIELATNYAEPFLLQRLLKAMQHLRVEKKPALTFALLIMLARIINAQSEVFSLWYGRRCYERSRGEMITMIYEKTLHRKVTAQPKSDQNEDDKNDSQQVTTEQAPTDDESTPLLASKAPEAPPKSQRWSVTFAELWQSFRAGIKGIDVKKQEPAGLGKILNLMRNDAYEVSQRFWDFQKLIEKPFGLILSLALIWNLLGWPALVGIAVIVFSQVMNYFLALVQVRFEKTRRAATDKRLQQTSQYIESIRHLRWYGWQFHWLENVFRARHKELNLRAVTYLWVEFTVFNNIFSSGLVTVAAFWAYTVLAKRQLTVDIVFPALEIFNMLQDNMGDIPELVTAVLNALVALKRIEVFMDEPEKIDDADKHNTSADARIELEDASFAWPGLQQDVLQNLNLSFGPGVSVVAGEVASGKTALLQAILGELDRTAGRLIKPAVAFAYCAQTPWLQSMTIRDNILFNSPFDPDRYRRVLQSCALIPDFASFEKGDLSPIGENGIGLSGGQKARVALARAVYSNAPVLLLDDPLSALDQQTSEYIVSECFRGGLIKGRTVVLVTHRVDLCRPMAMQFIVMAHGRASVTKQDPSIEARLDDDMQAGNTNGNGSLVSLETKLLEDAIPDKFESEEHREHGEVKGRVYWAYLKAGNLWWWAIMVVAAIITRFVLVGVTWYLKEFGEAYEGHHDALTLITVNHNVHISENQVPLLRRFFDQFPSPLDNVMPWLIGLLILTTIQATALTTVQGATMVTRFLAGKNLFLAVMRKISNTTFRYYDITPVGRLLNRLTSDMGQVDSGTGWDIFNVFWQGSAWVFSLVVVASVTPLFLLICILLSIGFVIVFYEFLPASQSLRRLETVSLSPLMINFGALLSGLTTVRAFRAEDRFQAKLIKVVDNFQGMDHHYWGVQGWLGYRLEIMSAVSTLLLTLVAIYTNLSAGLTAFALVSARRFVRATQSLCQLYGRLQVNFVSVERVVELLDLEQEPSADSPPPAWWPAFGGSIVFENVTIRYAPHLDPALIDVSFELKGGTNTAIVGRTGSGKSTLASSLLATVPVEKGRILIDGIDLATVDRHILRSRITYLAQEPVLFEGTLRHNLDPTREHSDEDCKDVIRRVADKFGWTLATPVEAGGKNLSQGQRQLVGLARAILRRSSVIIMDEATASIDVETAWEIQRVLREELKGSTVITIAHRTAAVRDADNAIVLANGRLQSFGPASGGSEGSSDTPHV